MDIRKIDIKRINMTEYNPRKDLQPGDAEYEKLKQSIKEFGYIDPIIWNESTGNVVGGHQRLKILIEHGYKEVEVSLINLDEVKEKALNIALNKIGGEWDFDKLENLLKELENEIDILLTGFDEEEINKLVEESNTIFDKLDDSMAKPLVETFITPPFSVIDTRQGYWQNRKSEWLNLGIKSDEGRGKSLVFGKALKFGENLSGTSVFDPVLCEAMYKWFNIDKAHILDPFAGGSVRGIVANKLGYKYTGIDLRQEQIDNNINNAKSLHINIEDESNFINWICDDSRNLDKYIEDNAVDMVFTCPPYFDLEVYSDDEKDISNMSYEDFETCYKEILIKSANKLKENRFAIVVISDVRDKQGFYRDLTGITKEAFNSQGLYLYNDIILLNVAGTAAIRARRSMINRKTIRVHQNVMVFYKGNPKNIKKYFHELSEFKEFDQIYVEDSQESP